MNPSQLTPACGGNFGERWGIKNAGRVNQSCHGAKASNYSPVMKIWQMEEIQKSMGRVNQS
jgi:hypothetical protein